MFILSNSWLDECLLFLGTLLSKINVEIKDAKKEFYGRDATNQPELSSLLLALLHMKEYASDQSRI